MVSINTTSVNRTVLATLRQTNTDLATSQNRIASGLKVASALDNASVWATAQTIRKDIAAQDAVDGSIAIAKGQADAGSAALSTISDLLQKVKTAAAGLADGSGTAKPNNLVIRDQIKTYVDQILSVAKSASFQGVNLLTDAAGALTPQVGYDNGAAINASFTKIQMIDATGANGSLATVFSYGNSSGSPVITDVMAPGNSAGQIGTVQTAINTAITNVTNYQATVASYANSLTSQQDFFDKLKDIRSTALSALVDADMTEESSRIQALQVKQQLAYQALSMGNSSSQNILALFR